MAADRNTDDARERYRRGLLVSRLGGLAGTIGFVTTVAADGNVGGEILGGVMLIACMASIHVGGQLMGESSVWLSAWLPRGDEE